MVKSPIAAVFGLLALVALSLMACTSEAKPTPIAGVNLVVASSDLAVGPNRFTFGLLDNEQRPIIIKASQVAASFYYLEGNSSQFKETKQAIFYPWPGRIGGVYVTQTSFDKAGTWQVTATVPVNGKSRQQAQGAFSVAERPSTPAIGALPPRSQNRTAQDGASLKELTTAEPPDPDLYQTTIAQAMASGLPTVVVFATPAYCITRTCGPQVSVVEGIKNGYKGRANFIHIEIYDNPDKIQGDLRRGILNPLVTEWGLNSEPYTFILDREGKVAAKFEGFTTADELEAELKKVI